MTKSIAKSTALAVLEGGRRVLIAEFMDENPEAFPHPVAGKGWVAHCQENDAFSAQEKKVFDRGLGILASVFRTAQLSMNATESLSDLLSPESLPEVQEVEIDPLAFAMMGGDHDDEEAIAFARSVTILKRMTGLGVVNPEQILALIEQTMDALPGNSKMQRSAVESAKRMALANVEYMMVR